MSAWPRYPTLYEINTWVWLSDLRVKTGRPVDLGSVPGAEWDAIARFGFDAVWFMGVWERSPAGIAIANQNMNLVADFRGALPDFKPEDNIGEIVGAMNIAERCGARALTLRALRALDARRRWLARLAVVLVARDDKRERRDDR